MRHDNGEASLCHLLDVFCHLLADLPEVESLFEVY